MGGLGHVDFSFLKPLQEVVRREVDQFHLVGLFQDIVGKGFPHDDPRNLGHDVVQAFEVLDIEGGVNIDAQVQQFLNILPAFSVPRAGSVSMGQLVHQQEAGLALQGPVNIEFLQGGAPVFQFLGWEDFQPVQQGGRFLAAVGFQKAHHHVDALGLLGPRGLQHGIGFSHARGSAEKNLQLAPFFMGGFHLDTA